jgi:hypothetical protein
VDLKAKEVSQKPIENQNPLVQLALQSELYFLWYLVDQLMVKEYQFSR